MAFTMTDVTPLQGELQTQIMAAIWRLDEGTVEQVRQALPSHHQGAYNTVHTVLNRLAERGLLTRRREGHVIVYAPSRIVGGPSGRHRAAHRQPAPR